VVLTIAAIGVVACASLAWIYGDHLAAGGPIRSDGMGYYLYLPAVLLDHDLTMAGALRRANRLDPASVAGDGRTVPPHGDYLDQYPIGEAVMLTPFFGVGYALTSAGGHGDGGGFSIWYRRTAAAGGLVYALLGLAITASILLRWFRASTVPVVLLAITFGTDLFHYATYDSIFSHAFSFFLVAAAIRLSLSIWENPRAANAALLAATVGLLAIVRPTNLVVLVFCALIGIRTLADLRARFMSLCRHWPLLVLSAAIVGAVCAPQLVYWYEVTGRLIVNAYPDGQHLQLGHPHLVGVLFSVRKGLFFWAPLLLLAVAGFPVLRRAAPALFVPAVAYLIVQVWVVSSWSVWWYGGSFGMRPFVESMPVFALGLAAVIELPKSRFVQPLFNVCFFLTIFFSVHAMLAYWTGWIPFDGTTIHLYLESFKRL
jgi:hypothetical protein